MGRGKEPRRTQDEGWNNVPNKAAKIQEKVDPSKLKLSKVFWLKANISIFSFLLQVDVNSFSFGPPGGSRPGGFNNWSRGSASSSQANKKMSMQVCLKGWNFFAIPLFIVI